MARLVTLATRPAISAYTMMPTTPSSTAHASDMPNRAPGRGVGHDVADVDEPAHGGEDAEGDAEDLLHARGPGSSMNVCSCAASRRSGFA